MAGHNIWDYVIIGGGSAGCVVANRLSADETARCLLLEAGGEDWSPFIQVPAGLTILSRKYDWSYEAEPDQSRGGVVDNWAAGKVLGGGSSINAMLWVRGHRGDFDHWQELGCDGWRYDDVLPYFVKAETFEDIESEFRGSKGPQHVSHVRSPQPMTDAFIEAALEQGFEAQDDYNGAIQEGVTEAQLSQKKGLRHSTARAYLSPARRRRNLSLRKHSFVTRVLFEGRRAIGVEYIYRGRTRRVFADREVILCAGAFGSPKILMLSGIGPADQLRSFGISVVLNSPGVGQNLQEHPCVRMVYLVDARTLNRELNPRGVIRHGADFLFRRRGAATSAIAHALLFFSLQDSNRWTDVQVIFSPFGISGANGDSSASDSAAGGYRHDVHDMRLMDTAAVMAYPCLLHPDSRGTVQLRSADPTDYPVIQHSLLGEVQRRGNADCSLSKNPLDLRDQCIPAPLAQRTVAW